MGVLNRRCNYCQHSFGLVQHLVVPEAQHPIATRLDKARSRQVVFGSFLVLATIQFDYQAMFRAGEIGNVWANRKLAPEVRIMNLPASQAIPEMLLRVSEVLAKSTCMLLRIWIAHL